MGTMFDTEVFFGALPPRRRGPNCRRAIRAALGPAFAGEGQCGEYPRECKLSRICIVTSPHETRQPTR